MGKKENRILKGLPATSHIQCRTAKNIAAATLETQKKIAYQHSVLCQTSLPYRNPGPDVRIWDREQGAVSLTIEAGRAKNPKTREWIQLGLPFGPKPRLILAYLNAKSLKTGSPKIDVGESFTAFVRRIQDYRPNGHQIRAFKTHLGCLATATIRMAMSTDSHSVQINNQIVTNFDLWFSKNEQQRVLWPSSIQLSHEYFTSLQNHAVPLNERALASLAHSAMALDIYAWLAQRLHRIPRGRPQPITWVALKDQFGSGYAQIRQFKVAFRAALYQVLTFYPAAKVESDSRGITVYNSAPPVKKRLVLVDKSQG